MKRDIKIGSVHFNSSIFLTPMKVDVLKLGKKVSLNDTLFTELRQPKGNFERLQNLKCS